MGRGHTTSTAQKTQLSQSPAEKKLRRIFHFLKIKVAHLRVHIRTNRQTDTDSNIHPRPKISNAMKPRRQNVINQTRRWTSSYEVRS